MSLLQISEMMLRRTALNELRSVSSSYTARTSAAATTCGDILCASVCHDVGDAHRRYQFVLRVDAEREHPTTYERYSRMPASSDSINALCQWQTDVQMPTCDANGHAPNSAADVGNATSPHAARRTKVPDVAISVLCFNACKRATDA